MSSIRRAIVKFIKFIIIEGWCNFLYHRTWLLQQSEGTGIAWLFGSIVGHFRIVGGHFRIVGGHFRIVGHIENLMDARIVCSIQGFLVAAVHNQAIEHPEVMSRQIHHPFFHFCAPGSIVLVEHLFK